MRTAGLPAPVAGSAVAAAAAAGSAYHPANARPSARGMGRRSNSRSCTCSCRAIVAPSSMNDTAHAPATAVLSASSCSAGVSGVGVGVGEGVARAGAGVAASVDPLAHAARAVVSSTTTAAPTALARRLRPCRCMAGTRFPILTLATPGRRRSQRSGRGCPNRGAQNRMTCRTARPSASMSIAALTSSRLISSLMSASTGSRPSRHSCA